MSPQSAPCAAPPRSRPVHCEPCVPCAADHDLVLAEGILQRITPSGERERHAGLGSEHGAGTARDPAAPDLERQVAEMRAATIDEQATGPAVEAQRTEPEGPAVEIAAKRRAAVVPVDPAVGRMRAS